MPRRRTLFHHAPSELSQDAFLAWLAECALDDDREDLRDLGRKFLAWLLGKGRQERVVAEDVGLSRVKRQSDGIDLLIEATVAGSPVTIVIEDKTQTSHHDDQLRRYRERHPEAVFLYLKTGYHFGEDIQARSHGYVVIGLRDWVDFLEAQRVKHDVFEEYRSYVIEVLRDRESRLERLLADGGHEELGVDYAQHDLLLRLRDRCEDISIGGSAINHARNRGGSPWAHWRFALFPDALGPAVDEMLFHRVDARVDAELGKPAYCVAMRQYADVKGKEASWDTKLARLRRHRQAFDDAVTASGCALRPGRTNPARRGANESEIGILFFDESANTVRNVFALFPALHRAFVERLRSQPT